MCQNSSFYAEIFSSLKSLGVGHWFWCISDLAHSTINKIDFTAAEERSVFSFLQQTLAFSHTEIYSIPCIFSMKVKIKVMVLTHHNSEGYHSTSEMQSNGFPSPFLKGCMKFLLGYWQQLSQIASVPGWYNQFWAICSHPLQREVFWDKLLARKAVVCTSVITRQRNKPWGTTTSSTT